MENQLSFAEILDSTNYWSGYYRRGARGPAQFFRILKGKIRAGAGGGAAGPGSSAHTAIKNTVDSFPRNLVFKKAVKLGGIPSTKRTGANKENEDENDVGPPGTFSHIGVRSSDQFAVKQTIDGHNFTRPKSCGAGESMKSFLKERSIFTNILKGKEIRSAGKPKSTENDNNGPLKINEAAEARRARLEEYNERTLIALRNQKGFHEERLVLDDYYFDESYCGHKANCDYIGPGGPSNIAKPPLTRSNVVAYPLPKAAPTGVPKGAIPDGISKAASAVKDETASSAPKMRARRKPAWGSEKPKHKMRAANAPNPEKALEEANDLIEKFFMNSNADDQNKNGNVGVNGNGNAGVNAKRRVSFGEKDSIVGSDWNGTSKNSANKIATIPLDFGAMKKAIPKSGDNAPLRNILYQNFQRGSTKYNKNSDFLATSITKMNEAPKASRYQHEEDYSYITQRPSCMGTIIPPPIDGKADTKVKLDPKRYTANTVDGLFICVEIWRPTADELSFMEREFPEIKRKPGRREGFPIR